MESAPTQWDPARSLAWNIVNRLLRKGAVLYDEAELMLKEELGTDASTYFSILSAVAAGATRQSEIADKSGVAPSSVSKYLNQLARLHMLEHIYPIGAGEASRRGIWQLSDHYLRAWFRFVRANRTDLEARRAEDVFRRSVRDRLDEFISKPAFEDAVRDHARRSIGADPEFPATATIGAWWGPIPNERHPASRRTRQGEIDLVGYDGKRLVLAGEAKWRTGPEGGEALRRLQTTVRHVPGYDPTVTRLVLYARDGFTDALRARAQTEGIILRSVEGLYR